VCFETPYNLSTEIDSVKKTTTTKQKNKKATSLELFELMNCQNQLANTATPFDNLMVQQTSG